MRKDQVIQMLKEKSQLSVRKRFLQFLRTDFYLEEICLLSQWSLNRKQAGGTLLFSLLYLQTAAPCSWFLGIKCIAAEQTMEQPQHGGRECCLSAPPSSCNLPWPWPWPQHMGQLVCPVLQVIGQPVKLTVVVSKHTVYFCLLIDKSTISLQLYTHCDSGSEYTEDTAGSPQSTEWLVPPFWNPHLSI